MDPVPVKGSFAAYDRYAEMTNQKAPGSFGPPLGLKLAALNFRHGNLSQKIVWDALRADTAMISYHTGRSRTFLYSEIFERSKIKQGLEIDKTNIDKLMVAVVETADSAIKAVREENANNIIDDYSIHHEEHIFAGDERFPPLREFENVKKHFGHHVANLVKEAYQEFAIPPKFNDVIEKISTNLDEKFPTTSLMLRILVLGAKRKKSDGTLGDDGQLSARVQRAINAEQKKYLGQVKPFKVPDSTRIQDLEKYLRAGSGNLNS